MKRICVVFLFLNIFSNSSLCGQTLVDQIKNAYNSLDTVLYINNLIVSYEETYMEAQEEWDNFELELKGFDYVNMDSIQRKNILDSLNEVYRKQTDSLNNYRLDKYKIKIKSKEEERENAVKKISDKVKSGTPVFVLNLETNEELELQPDTNKLPFNLFYFDKEYKGNLFVYCEEGQCGGGCETDYMSFAPKLTKNAPGVFRKIMLKQPQYLLRCDEMEGMNTILYMLDDKIYVYRIIQKEEYGLDEYIQKFGFQQRDLFKRLKRLNSRE